MLTRLLPFILLVAACQKTIPDPVSKRECWHCKPAFRLEGPNPRLQFVGDARIDALAGYLAAQDRVESQQVGFGGTFSEVYQVYVKLREQATQEQLILLLQHRSPNVRYYALLGLCRRNPEQKEIFYRQLAGKYETLNSISGCVVTSGELWQFATYRVFEAENWMEEELEEVY